MNAQKKSSRGYKRILGYVLVDTKNISCTKKEKLCYSLKVGGKILGKISKGTECSVRGCKEEAVKSLSVHKAKAAKLQIEESRRTYLCKYHYKKYKKNTKKERTIEKWRQNNKVSRSSFTSSFKSSI